MKLKKLTALVLTAVMAITLSACGGGAADNGTEKTQENTGTESTGDSNVGEGGEITFTYLELGDQGTGLEDFYREVVDDFNNNNKGTYAVDVEWMQGSSPDYNNKLRMLNAADQLPTIFDAGGEISLYNTLKNNGRLVDVKPYIDADPEWKARLEDDCIEQFIEDDGAIYMVPEAAMCPVGIFWNKDLFAKAGIESFPETWDEFWEACDTLQAAGITPLALQTAGSAWTSMIIATSYMSSSQEGIDFMNLSFPETYDTPEFREMMEVYVKLFQYCNPDAIGGDYSLAQNHFTNEEAAMMINGAWMMETLRDTNYSPEGFEQHVGFTTLPGKTVVYSWNQVGRVISASATEEEIEAAVEYMKTLSTKEHVIRYFELTGGYSSKVELPEETYNNLMPTMKEYADMFKDIDHVIPNYQTQWNSIILNEVFTTDLPALVQGSIDMDQFIQIMDDAVKQYEE
ncbi:MAG: extracellular solute-binding protein [Lachnospiraceae bacterium]|nr:extracellular solute-binding protein [Lachnospiraceae bacterium]